MSKKKFISTLVALILCVSTILSMVVVAAGEENQEPTTGETSVSIFAAIM